VRKTILGLPGFHGCGYAAVDEGQIIVPADRIRTHTQTEHIYDIYYKIDQKHLWSEISKSLRRGDLIPN